MATNRKKSNWHNSPNHQGARPAEKGRLIESLEALERRMIQAAIKNHDGNLRAAAMDLGVNRGGLYKRMNRLGIQLDDYRAA